MLEYPPQQIKWLHCNNSVTTASSKEIGCCTDDVTWDVFRNYSIPQPGSGLPFGYHHEGQGFQEMLSHAVEGTEVQLFRLWTCESISIPAQVNPCDIRGSLGRVHEDYCILGSNAVQSGKQVLTKYWCLSTSLQGITSQKAPIFTDKSRLHCHTHIL